MKTSANDGGVRSRAAAAITGARLDRLHEAGLVVVELEAVSDVCEAAGFARRCLSEGRDNDVRTILNRLQRGLDWRTGKPDGSQETYEAGETSNHDRPGPERDATARRQ